MNPEEVERVVGRITEKDVMDFARRKLWDQDVAVSAVGSIEGKRMLHLRRLIVWNRSLILWPRVTRL